MFILPPPPPPARQSEHLKAHFHFVFCLSITHTHYTSASAMVPDNGNSCTAVITSTNTSATQTTSIEMATSSASEGGQLSLTSTMATNTPSPSSSSVTIAASGGEGSHHHHHHRSSHRHQSRSPSSAAAPRGVSSSSSSASSSSTTTSSSSAHDYLYFDSNTFKQVKRLYCGMLLVAVAYSLTMIVMMVFLYKTLPHPGMAGGSATFGGGSLVPSASNSPSSHAGFNLKLYSHSAMAGVPSPTDADHALQMFGSESKSVFQRGNSLSDGPLPAALPAAPEAAASTASASSPSAVSGTSTTTGGGFFRSHDGRLAISHETARTYLDQVIAINFLTLILYSLAFYAAHRELYTLTLAFTSTLSFTMSKCWWWWWWGDDEVFD